MDIKSLLQTFNTIAEDSKVHKGTYGTSYGKEDVRDQYGHKIGKVDKGAEAKKDEPKKGRGRPKKGAGASGEDKSYDSSELSAAFGGGKKPSKEVGKRSVKHSLKDWIEDVAQSKETLSEEQVTIKPMPGASQIIGQDGKSMGTADAQTANVIKAASEKGTLNLTGDELSEKSDKSVTTNSAAKGKYDGKSKQELLKAFNHLKKTGPHEKGSKPHGNMKELATAIRAKYSSKEKVAEAIPVATGSAPAATTPAAGPIVLVHKAYRENIAKAKEVLERFHHSEGIGKQLKLYPPSGKYGPDYYEFHLDKKPHNTVDMVERTLKSEGVKAGVVDGREGMAEAKDLPGKQDNLDIAKPKGKLTKADFEALRAKKKVKESRIMKIVEGINFKELMATADSEVQEMLIELQNDVELFKDTGHTSDLLDSFLKVHLHHNKNKITDEGSVQDHTTHGMDSKPASLNMVNPNPAPTSFKVDPVQATTDRMLGGAEKAGSFLRNLVAPKKTFESNTMKDIQLENWEKELNSLLTLNEGITVSSSTGQQGSPDSVSVNATDADAQQLLQVLRQAGVGVFGGDQEHSQYGAPMNGDTDGHGTEPESSPTVVGDGDDMMSLIKKMTGIQDSGEDHGEAQGTLEPAGEEGHDYEDEEGSEEQDGDEKLDELSPETISSYQQKATPQAFDASNPKSGQRTAGLVSTIGRTTSEGEDEVTDEGNAFGNEVRTKKADNIPDSQQRITTGGQNLPVKEQGHDHEESETCNECGMYEARCVCEPGEEQVEEMFANNDDERRDAINATNPPKTTYSQPNPERMGYNGPAIPAKHNTYDRKSVASNISGKDSAAYDYRESMEENFANEPDEEMMRLKDLLGLGNDLHRQKRNQAVGNPTQVTFETKLLKDSSNLLTDWKKLSGIK